MEADPIIPAIVPTHLSPHLRHQEEFPNDEGVTSPFHGSSGVASADRAHKSTISGGRNLNLNSGSAKTSADVERKLSHSSRASSSASNKRQESLDPAASEGEETPIGLRLLAEHSAKSPQSHLKTPSSNDDMNYIDMNMFQKSTAASPNRARSNSNSGAAARRPQDKKQAPVDLSSYKLPDNSIRNRSVEEDRRQLELEKEAFEKSKAKHNSQMIRETSMLDVDETIDTTQSSEQKFLSLEDVRGIFQDVKGSGILNCVGNEALQGVDDGDNHKNLSNVYEDSALLGRITSGIRDSLQILSPSANLSTKVDEIPMEIEIPNLPGDDQPDTIDSQISGLDGDHHPPPPPPAPRVQSTPPPPPPAEDFHQVYQHQREKPAVPAAAAHTPERSTHNPLQQMSPLERKVSKVIMKMQDEELARLEKERADIAALRNTTKAPETVIEGISFLRAKEKAREKLEAEAKQKAKREQEQKKKEPQEEKKEDVTSKMDNNLEASLLYLDSYETIPKH